jgi:hypothetical protein
MKRLIKIVDSWYGEGTRRRVFEPLLADLGSDLQRDRSLFARARWWWALVSTFIALLPRATFSDVPNALIADLLARAIAFGAVGFGLQWLVGGAASQQYPGLWPPSIATTLPIVVIPVVWRIRTAVLAFYQRRLLTITVTAMFILLTVISSQAWPLAIANTIGVVLLSWMGWKAGDPDRVLRSPSSQTWWFRIVAPASAILIATWPLKVALGIRLLDTLGSYQLVAYGAGALIAICTRHTDHAAAARNR